MLKGLAQHWYSNLPNGHIRASDLFRAELPAVFQAPKLDEVKSCDFHNLKQEGSTLQGYLHHLIRLRKRALDVVEKTIIDRGRSMYLPAEWGPRTRVTVDGHYTLILAANHYY